MAMAIHGGKLLSDSILQNFSDRNLMEKTYQNAWKKNFKQRLWIGRNVQKLFGNEVISEIALSTMKTIKPLLRTVMKATHGEVF
jgi:flavin-dependent dehydrogenase